MMDTQQGHFETKIVLLQLLSISCLGLGLYMYGKLLYLFAYKLSDLCMKINWELVKLKEEKSSWAYSQVFLSKKKLSMREYGKLNIYSVISHMIINKHKLLVLPKIIVGQWFIYLGGGS